MVLPAAITTMMVGITIGFAFFVIGNIFNNFNEENEYSYPERSSENRAGHSRKNDTDRLYKKELNPNDLCCICQDIFGVANVKLLNCGHYIHKNCYEAYEKHFTGLNRVTCPVCRKSQ